MSSWWVDRWRSLLHVELGFSAGDLRAGRNVARAAAGDAIEVAPGQVTVRFTDRGEFAATLTTSGLATEQRRAAIALAVADPALVAGVLLGELPAALDAPWRSAGISLVPDAGEVALHCSCDDWNERCRHTAGVGELVARMIDVDPYVLLTLRGWSRGDFVSELRQARAEELGVELERSDEPRGADPGMGAAAAIARVPASVPALRPVPRRPGRARVYTSPPPDAGLERDDIAALIGDAAERASAVLGAEAPTGLHLELEADLARRGAANLDDPAALEELARSVGEDPHRFEARARAWSVAGLDGLTAHDQSWTASSAQLEPGRRAFGGRGRSWSNLVQHADRQLRLDTEGRWWAFRADPRLGWILESGGLTDPEDL